MKHKESKLIRCVLPVGKALPILENLKDHKGIITANINYARGLTAGTSILVKKAIEVRVEKELLEVVVPAARADELFEFIYEDAGIGEARGGFMYMIALKRDVPFVLPSLPELSE